MEVNPNLSQKATEDLELVKKALQNDQKAYAELMVRYKDSIYFMISSKDIASYINFNSPVMGILYTIG